MKKWILGLVLVGLVACFSVFSIRLLFSQTAYDNAVASSHAGEQAGPIDPNPKKTGLYVAGDTGLERSVAQKLYRALANQPGFGDVEWVNSQVERFEAPLLSVELTQHKLLWTPVVGWAEVTAQAAYGTNGDIAFRHSQPVHFQSASGPAALQMLGTYNLADRSWGLMSKKGYEDFLADRIVEAVVKSLMEQRAK